MIVLLVQAPPSALAHVNWVRLDNCILFEGHFEGERIYMRYIGANLAELHVPSVELLEKLWAATPSGSGAKILTPGEARTKGLAQKVSRFSGGREAKDDDVKTIKDKVK